MNPTTSFLSQTAMIVALGALAACPGCDKSPSTPAASGTPAAPSAAAPPASAAPATPPAQRLPDGFVVRAAAPQAVPAGTCKASAKQGDTVTVLGRIGGSVEPFAASRAIFTIVDPALKACSDMAEPDHCATPWDYCCEGRESLLANTVTIEVVGADGKALPFTVRGAEGLEPLTRVAVTGKVVERNDKGLFVVRAEKIAIQ